jgi:micrococcal nuclease
MKRMPQKAATRLTALLLLAGLLGYNYTVKINPDLAVPTQSTPNVNSQSLTKQPPTTVEPTANQETGTCVSVYDGDTITVRLNKSPQTLTKVRLIGLDTPELKSGEFGETAGNVTRSRLLGQKLKLEYDKELYDKYGRSLAYVYLNDGTFINAILLEQGYARVMTIPPNTAHAAEFKVLETKAQQQHSGIWSQPPHKCTWREESVVQEWSY